MTTRNLRKIFDPKRIAVIGASDTPHAVGSIALHNLIVERGDRVVYPVNATRESVHGIQAYPNVAAVPNPPDLALICSEAAAVPQAVSECGEMGIEGVVILSPGFREAGPEGQALEDDIRRRARGYPEMRILGPNSFGVIVPRLGLNASLAMGLPKQGHVAFVSQSQALSVATLDRALIEHVGFSHFVSVGSGIDINLSDLIDYFGGDPWTLALILYVVSIDDVREFMSATRAFARSKPIVAYRSGRFAESKEGAVLHTGQLVGEDAVYDAAFQRAGMVRVSQIDDIFDCAELLARQRTPQGDRLSILSNAGEPAGVAADALLDRHGVLAPLSEKTSGQLARLVLDTYPHTNPAHLPRSATREDYAQATRLVLEDPNVDAALVILVPRGTTDPMRVAEAISEVAAHSRKPILATLDGRAKRYRPESRFSRNRVCRSTRRPSKPCGPSCTWCRTLATAKACMKPRATFRSCSPAVVADCVGWFSSRRQKFCPNGSPKPCSPPTAFPSRNHSSPTRRTKPSRWRGRLVSPSS